jgi:putative ABC transport system substrate-binding protein
MKQAIPGVRRVAFLWNRTNPGNASNVPGVKENRKFEQTMGLTVQSHPVQAPEEFDSAFEKMTKEHTDVVEVASDGMLIFHRRRLAELAMKHRLPSLFASRDHAEAGGLMSYSSDWSDSLRRIALQVNKILRGAKPADLPVEQPTKFELVINLKTAKALGLTIPQSLLLRADEVIQ